MIAPNTAFSLWLANMALMLSPLRLSLNFIFFMV